MLQAVPEPLQVKLWGGGGLSLEQNLVTSTGIMSNIFVTVVQSFCLSVLEEKLNIISSVHH
jgi:hypothetical protein